MRTRHSTEPLPRSFAGHPAARKALLVSRLRLVPTSRLWLALLVFRNPRDLRSFWKEAIGSDLGLDCKGAVNGMGEIVVKPQADGNDRKHYEVDPRWFAIMGLTLGNLSMEVITHESIHAGCRYASRATLTSQRPFIGDDPEERICYPSGIIAARINTLLERHGMYEMAEQYRKLRR